MILPLALLALLPGAAPPPPPLERIPLVARPLGPATMGGRITSLAVVEGKPAIQYVGAASGGLWKTSDNGLSWKPVFDGRPNASIGAVTVAPSNPEVVWVGTGEANARNSVSWGDGVFRSLDGGRSWRYRGLPETHHIGRIVVHPRDPDTAYVAALGHLWGANPQRGVFKTSDGGKTWQHSLALDNETGCVDLVMDPADPQTLYAAAYRVRRGPFSGGDPAVQFGPRAGLYRSRDGGKTWARLTKGLPTRPLGRCGLSVSRSSPELLYAVIQTDRTDTRRVAGQPPKASTEAETGGIFRSRDRGESWEKVNDLCPRPFYFAQIRIDPRDEDRLYVLGIPLYASRDGGRTFRSDAGRGVHVDHHDLWIDPHDSSHLILGNDGGLYYSTNQAVSWLAVRNLPIGQFYGIAVDMRKPYRIYGGLQDNGSWGGPSRTRNPAGILNADWQRVLAMDGFHCQVDPADPDTVYAEGQYGKPFRIDLRTRGGKSIRPPQPAGTPAHRFNWSSPMLLSPHDPKTVYYGGNVLFRSRDRGDTWQVVSPDLTRGEPGASRDTGHTLTTLAESPALEGVLWAGSDDGRVHVSKNGGKTWADVSARLRGVPAARWITRVECSPLAPGTCWLSLTRYRQDDRAPYLFRTDDYGQTWRSLVGTLPAEGPVHVVKVDPRNHEVLYVGTELGLYVSLDGGMSWKELGAGLPPVPVHDLVVHPRDAELVVATHGRSLYVIDVAPLQELTARARSQAVHLCAVRPVTLRRMTPAPEPVPSRTYAAPNPPDEVVIHYWLKAPLAGLRVKVLDSGGKVVVERAGPGGRGLHRVAWSAHKGGKVVAPGEYTVVLQAGELALKTKARVALE